MTTSTRRRFLLHGAGTAALSAASCGRPPGGTTAKQHVVLLGDSIFDNGVYVRGKPSVGEQLAAELGERGTATLLAVDGSVTKDVAGQLARLPADATHLAISSGGNDALRQRSLLDKEIAQSSLLFADLASIQKQFRDSYRAMLGAVRATGTPVVVCTIYDSNFELPEKALADVALSMWNDVIVRCAGEAGVPVIDLRRIFTARADYANAIEPSEVGGEKMVKVIARVVHEHDFAKNTTAIYA